MSNLISSDFNPEWEDQELSNHPEGVIGVTGEDEVVNKLSREIDFEWQHPKRKMTGRERYLYLCRKMGLRPKGENL
jgi:hypothetical protein